MVFCCLFTVIDHSYYFQVRLYDISAQRRPVISFDFLEAPITAVTEDLNGRTVYVGNGSGDLASYDIRTGILLKIFHVFF